MSDSTQSTCDFWFANAASTLHGMLEDHPRVSSFDIQIDSDAKSIVAEVKVRTGWFRKKTFNSSLTLNTPIYGPIDVEAELNNWIATTIKMVGD